MLRDFSVPEDGPAEVLAELVHRLGLRYSRGHVRALLERHANPGSLLALVDVARALGVETTAGRAEPDAIDDIWPDGSPAILHFDTSPHGGGFGLLEGATPEGFLVWDSRHGSRPMNRDEFANAWSGVIVFAEKGAPGAPERGYLRHRAKELLFDEARVSPELAGASSPRPLHALLGLSLLVVLVLAALSQPAAWRLPTAVFAGLSALGLAASTAALVWARGGKASFLCGSGGRLDCESVLLSPYSQVAGIPLAGFGFAFYGAVLLLLCTAFTGSVTPVWAAGVAFVPTLPISVLLLFVQRRLRRFCTLCVTVHAVNVAGAATFLLLVPSSAVTPRLLAALAFLALTFGLLLSSVVPYLAHRREDEQLRHAYQRLSRSPLASLGELSEEPPLPIDARAAGVLLGASSTPHEVLVIAHPSCHLCGPALDALAELVERHPSLVHGYVGVAPVDPSNPSDQALCEALCAVGVTQGGAALLQAFHLAKRDLSRLRQSDPLEHLSAALRIERAVLERGRESARPLVQQAAAWKERYAEGIPAVFVDRRHSTASMSDVQTWFNRPPLAALLPADRPPRPEEKGRVHA